MTNNKKPMRFGAMVLGASLMAGIVAAAPTDPVFEKSITELQEAQQAGTLSSRALVDAYLARIEAYDHAGPKLNSIIVLNPRAREEADALDKERKHRGPRGPLHGIPVLVKDNYDTLGMPTSGGSLALATLQTKTEAFQVRRLRAAGAVILGKTTMHELAAGITTQSSLTGFTRNPYDPSRLPGGSSGGTGAAIGASFAAAGMGSDTSGSIRIPSAYQNLVGLRLTRGLASRSGVMPLSSSEDVAAPMARSVLDLVLMLDATVGPDPDDPTTADARRHIPRSYREALHADGLKGARIGVVGVVFDEVQGRETNTVVRAALAKMKEQGAELIDITIPGLMESVEGTSTISDEMKFDLADYLSRRGAPVDSLGQILDLGIYSRFMDGQLRRRNEAPARDTPRFQEKLRKRAAVRATIVEVLKSQRLDALAYPTIGSVPAPLGDSQRGIDVAQLSSATGLPAISIPAGFTPGDLPIGMELLGAEFAETTLLRLAYAWEQFARPRRAPYSTPALVNGRAPQPLAFTTSITPPRSSAPLAQVRFDYDVPTATLAYTVTTTVAAADIIAMTLQAGSMEQPGPIVAHLMRPNQKALASSLVLGASQRAALEQGGLYVHLYTSALPLGAGRAQLVLPARD